VALDKYRAKRNFKESPEPSGDARLVAERAKKTKGEQPRFFCVQKHLASHLHYDFRLEHNGVLLSWAVPKGPSIDPQTKRLAMMVEDHPIEYGTFEGVIPSGYGAGIVMLWDQGVWTPEVDDIDAALQKGDLKFTLEGYKLKGSWVLVRTKGKWAGGGDRSWLLIKHRDNWAGEVDIADFAPLSVKSKGDFADILAEGNPDIWISHRPASGGEAGAMFEKIIARALEMRGAQGSGGSEGSKGSDGSKGSKSSKASKSSQGSASRGPAGSKKGVATKRAKRTRTP
jgi:DNA ligase D-like protein (predicted 3'-phosphoesterase)